ncbi:MAG: DUF423 domain-containing protein [Bdellovibrionales bacterium]|nr:DUF423 domain-containing protein [Bdellovibrionales bacterium]
MGRLWIINGCFFCLLTVVLGAFGAHALKEILPADSFKIYEVATQYMMMHGFALIALGLWSHWEKWASCFWCGMCFSLGIILFSGSLYGYIFTQARWMTYATPAGGLLFILGWIYFIISVFKTRNKFI